LLLAVNVVLVGVTGLVADIVKAALDEPDVDVIGEFCIEPFVVEEIADTPIDVVVLAADEDVESSTVPALLAQQPRMKVLAIRDDGRTASLFELRPVETMLGSLSPELLLQAVRTAHRSST
jgi:DNA-binding NarL/FixJ family response regulator